MTNFKSLLEMTFDSSIPRAQSAHRTRQEATRFQRRAKILISVDRTKQEAARLEKRAEIFKSIRSQPSHHGEEEG